jgi:hypothetical protein
MGLPFLAVAARSLPSLGEWEKQGLKLITEESLRKQQPDGSWEFFATLRRPPIGESQATDAAWIIMALEGETGPDAPGSRRAALARARARLDAASPPTSTRRRSRGCSWRSAPVNITAALT